jgi:hypothetical protein
MQDEKLYETSVQDGYIKSRVWGDADTEVFEASTAEVLAQREAHGINMLLCDISKLTPGNVDIPTQARGISILWKIHTFDKVALLLGDSRITSMLSSSLDITHLSGKFQSFPNEEAAIAWLKNS